MKRRELERYLRSRGCFAHHAGGKHDIWVNPANGALAPPRHAVIKIGTVRGICRLLGVPMP